MAKTKISPRERNRRQAQSCKQWRKDNPRAAHALRNLEARPVEPRGWIHFEA